MPASIDIRHQGLVPADLALRLILQDASPTREATLPLGKAGGRVISRNLASKRTQPPFSASAMDGYAVNLDGLYANTGKLVVVGEAAAGHGYGNAIKPNQAVRIFTGAPLPEGADTIVVQENVTKHGDEIVVAASDFPNAGKFVRKAGLDFSKGDVLLHSGDVLDPHLMALAASMDFAEIPVWEAPNVAVMATGDELVLPGEDAGPSQIIASNTFGIQAIASDAGAQVKDYGIIPDRVNDLADAAEMSLASGIDLIVTSGGASVGDHDLILPVFGELGFSFEFTKIAMRPGKPLLFAKRQVDGRTVRLLGLAGNPVSSLVSSHVFLRPLVNALSGFPAERVQPVKATLETPLPPNDERQDNLRAIARKNADGGISVAVFQKQDSSMLATLAKANCLVVREINAPAADQGDTVEIIPLRSIPTDRQ